MLGPPGSGKTMLARRMSSILPPLSFYEALECTKIHSIAGLIPSGTALISERPFRFPHHTISQAGLVGGGSIPGPGEISLSHNGVLFLDEFPEFPRATLELLRQPLEDGRLTISRAAMSLEFPCKFMLLASMNPCPCGYHGAPTGQGENRRECNCPTQQIQKYRAKISGPLLDRIDIHLTVPAVEYEKLAEARQGESSKNIRERVVRSRQIQQERFRNSSTRNNSGMTRKELESHAELSYPQGSPHHYRSGGAGKHRYSPCCRGHSVSKSGPACLRFIESNEQPAKSESTISLKLACVFVCDLAESVFSKIKKK
jgi:magnesium chelatase family protein